MEPTTAIDTEARAGQPPLRDTLVGVARQWQEHIKRARPIVRVKVRGGSFTAYAMGENLAPEGAVADSPTFADYLGAGNG